MTRQLLSFALALSCVCGVGALTPSVSCAAEPAQKVARLGFVGLESPSTTLRGVKTFWERLRELGWTRGQNLVVEERWAEGRVERLPGLMNEVIAQNVDVLFTYHTPAAVAAKSATNTVPIVAAWMGNAVGAGLAASQSRPGGNLTGISLAFDEEFSGKWLELLHETVPRLSTVAVIGNPASPWVRKVMSELETNGLWRGLRYRVSARSGVCGQASWGCQTR